MQNKSALNLNAEQAYINKKVGVAKVGMVLSWVSSITAILFGIFNTVASSLIEADTGSDLSGPLNQAIVCITILGIGEIFAGIMTLVYNAAKGKGIKEFKRMTGFKISWMMLLSALAAGPLATGLQVTAYSMAGITYVTAILALSPVLTAILGRIIFKENLSKRAVFGILLVVAGALVTTFIGTPDTAGSNFMVGIILACICPIGFALEGMFSTYAGDLIDPIEGCGFYRTICSGIMGLAAMLIIAGCSGNIGVWTATVKAVFTNPLTLVFVILFAAFVALSYNTTYVGFNKCGPSRCLAIVNTAPIWSIPIGLIFAQLMPKFYSYDVTGAAIISAVVVTIGVILVVMKPSELFKLRDVEE